MPRKKKKEKKFRQMTPLTPMGGRFTTARKDTGWSQEKVMADTGVHRTCLSSYETRGVIPSLETAAILAEYYGVSLDWLATN